MQISPQLEGRVLNTYMDPLSEYETDFQPSLSFVKTGWRKSR